MRFVDDEREAFAGQLADLLGDHGKLLKRGDDDRLARLERLLELARGGVDVLDHAQRLLELAHRRLELAIEHPPVGDDHDRVEDALVAGVVERREPVGEPGDGEALAAPSRVLDQVALPRPASARVGHQPAHAVELLVAREDQGALAGLAPLLVLLLALVDELAHQVEHAVARPRLVPQVRGGVPRARGRHGRIAGPAELALIEREEARLRPGEPRRDVDQVRIHREVRQAAAVGEERLARVAVGLVLADRVLDVLPVERVLQLGGEDRDAVEEEHEVEAVLVLRAIADLAYHGEEVRRVQPPCLLVEPASWTEVGELELAARVLDAVPQHVERAAPLDLGGNALQELLLHRRAVVLLELLPLPGLRGENEVHHVARQEAERAVVLLGAALAVATRRRLAVGRRWFADDRRVTRARIRAVEEKPALDRFLERTLGDLDAHATSSRTSILPVTAAEMRAVRSSLRRSIASPTFAMRASILTASRSRKAEMACCSSKRGCGSGTFRNSGIRNRGARSRTALHTTSMYPRLAMSRRAAAK